MQSTDGDSSSVMKKWIYVGYVRAHSHDIRALTVAVPINQEGFSAINALNTCFFFFFFSAYMNHISYMILKILL